VQEDDPLSRSCAGRGNGQGSQPASSTALAEAAALQQGDDLGFTSGPGFVHPPGHAGYVRKLPAAGDAGGYPF